MHHHMPPSKTGWPSFIMMIFPPPHPGQHKTVTTLEIIDQIHKLILEDCWISAKSKAEKLGISHEWVGSIIHEDLDIWKLSVKWVLKCLNADQKRQRCQSSEQLLEFFQRDPNDSCHDWWPWMKPGYITMTRRQSNNQRSGDIAAHPAQKNSECKNPLEKFLPWLFWINSILPLIILHGPNYQRGVLLISAGAIWRTFWKKNTTGRSPRGSCSCTTMPQLTCSPEETGLPGLPMSWSPTLFSGSGPVRLPPVPWTEKTIERTPFFFWCGGHCCHKDLVGWTTFWISFKWLAKVWATG